jgi:hypothetical protein
MDSREAQYRKPLGISASTGPNAIDLTRIYQTGEVDDGQRLVQLSSNDSSRRPGGKKSEHNPCIVLKRRVIPLLQTYVYMEVSMVVDMTFARRLAKSSRTSAEQKRNATRRR